jgi:exopolysaccharide biosynthesis polyprenyl glycosylphosphotransferase
MKLARRNSHYLLLVGDALIVPFSFILGHYLRFGNFDELSIKVPFLSLVWMTFGYLVVFYFLNVYETRIDLQSFGKLLRLFLSILVAAVFVSFLNYGLFLEPIGRGIFILANLSILVFTYVWRILFFQLLRFLFKPKRVLIVGTGEAGKEMAGVLERLSQDFHLVGFLEDDTRPLLEVCDDKNIELIVNSVSSPPGQELGRDLINARLVGLNVVEMPDLYQELEKKIPIDHMSEVWFLKAKGFDWSEKSFLFKVKRVLDVLFSLIILLICLPLFFIVSILIKLTSKGPVFYTQERIGKNETLFKLFKFRSMIDKAERGQAVWAAEDDQRVTGVGKILRKLHLDELPQLVNVLKGEMSLVGARPERPEFVAQLKEKIPFYSLRHFLKPGLTGWAQVNYPYASSVQDSKEKLKYDLYYVYHMNLFLDLRIILKTLQRIFHRKK